MTHIQDGHNIAGPLVPYNYMLHEITIENWDLICEYDVDFRKGCGGKGWGKVILVTALAHRKGEFQNLVVDCITD